MIQNQTLLFSTILQATQVHILSPYSPGASTLQYSGPTYMSAGMLGVHICFMAVGWTASSGPTYISAGMLGAHIYFMAVGWTTHSGPTYMSAGMLGVHMIISGPKCYMWL